MENRFACVSKNHLLEKVLCTGGSHVHFLRDCRKYVYADFEETAKERTAGRDEDDWPVAAVALALDSPIWTEDRDFFGAGIATWTTDRVELYLKR